MAIITRYHLPYDPKLKLRARELRKNLTDAEKKLWFGYLRSFPYSVLRQKPIDNYIVDFYIPKLKIVIEIDVDSHFTEEGEIHDERRTEILKSHGLEVIRFNNFDVLSNFEGVCQNIGEKIPLAPFIQRGDISH